MIKLIPSWLMKWVAAIGSLATLMLASWSLGRMGGANKEKLKQADEKLHDFTQTTERMNNAGNPNLDDADILDRLRRLGGQ